MMPLVIPKHIDSLRHFSTFAVSFMIYFALVIVVHSCTHGLPDNIHKISVSKDDDAPVVLFNSGNKAIEGLGVFIVCICLPMQLIRGVLGHDGPHAHQVHSCLRAGHDAVLPAVRHGVLLWLHGLWQEGGRLHPAHVRSTPRARGDGGLRWRSLQAVCLLLAALYALPQCHLPHYWVGCG
ncbi:putative amino acid transporter [Trypanosoma cruzi]|uniref:Putative amino acid transporter n=1 Tax=Trypanosoma cruzi TaxID=5693 RepID=A0A2V2ULS8_TRYCR|nr:putative amino acid transporter [Trypanosoma cruzi]